MSDRIVRIAALKIAQIREAGKKALSPEEYEDFNRLLNQLAAYGPTPYINAQLGKYMAKVAGAWELEIAESPEWAEALIECDRVFLGSELKEMCWASGLSDYGHKKELCRRLYNAGVEAVVDVMQPILEKEGGTTIEAVVKETVGEPEEREYELSPDQLKQLWDIATTNNIEKYVVEDLIKAYREGDLMKLEEMSDEYPDLSEFINELWEQLETMAKEPYLKKAFKKRR